MTKKAKSHVIPRMKTFEQKNKGKSKLKSVIKADEAHYEKMKDPIISGMLNQIRINS